MAKQPKKHRVTLDLSPRTMARLEALKQRTDQASHAAVIRRALEIYGALIDAPGEVWVRRADDSEYKLVLLEKPREAS